MRQSGDADKTLKNVLECGIRNRNDTFLSVVKKLILTVREWQGAQLFVQHRFFADQRKFQNSAASVMHALNATIDLER